MSRRKPTCLDIVIALTILGILIAVLSYEFEKVNKNGHPMGAIIVSSSREVEIAITDVANSADNQRSPHMQALNRTEWIPTSRSNHLQPLPSTFNWLYNSNNSTLLFSAHYDYRDKAIKITGFRNRFIPKPVDDVKCHFPDGSYALFYDFYNISALYPLEGLVYNSFVFICGYGGENVPRTIQIRSSEKTITIPVSYRQPVGGTFESKRLLLCVKPMVYGYANEYQFREFVEVSRFLGVGKIVLYPNSVAKSMLPVIEEYRQQGIVETHEWKPPISLPSMHAYGQKTHNQHCLYTYMYQYQWAAFIDLDELIVPNTRKDYELMIYEAVLQHPTKRIGGIVLRSQMCAVSVDDDPMYFKSPNMCQSTVLRKTNCTQPMPRGYWSKPLVRTQGTEIVDIHDIRLTRRGYSVVDLDPYIASVHHYRETDADTDVFQGFTTNIRKTTLHYYRDEISSLLGPKICSRRNEMLDEGNAKHGL